MKPISKYDDQENHLMVSPSGHIRLKLANESTPRWIGIFNNIDDGIYKKICKPENVLRKLNAFGFNEMILSLLKPALIQVKMENITYEINWANFNKYKQYLHFKSTGFELQCFVSLGRFHMVEDAQ